MCREQIREPMEDANEEALVHTKVNIVAGTNDDVGAGVVKGGVG